MKKVVYSFRDMEKKSKNGTKNPGHGKATMHRSDHMD